MSHVVRIARSNPALIQKMEAAAQSLIGEHDFRNFCKPDLTHGVPNFRRVILAAAVDPAPFTEAASADPSFRMYHLTISGYAFLWHQVRCIVAVLFLIGSGKESPSVRLATPVFGTE